jgi:hypothetical protein
MALISAKIPNLIQGVSQQPDDLRLFSQCEDQVNGFSGVVEGLRKRPPTEYVAKISSSTNFDNAYIHTINRDTSERYVVTITNGAIAVNSIDGTAKTVVAPSGLSYLASSTPRSSFETITVADYTFILNKSKTVAKSSTTSATRPFEAVWSVLQGNNQTQYSIVINGTTYSYTTTDTASTYQAENIATEIYNLINSLSGFTVTNLGTTLHISNNSDFTITAHDGYGNQASRIIKDKTNTFADLPAFAKNDMVIEITGSADNNFDNYYVKYVSDSSSDIGTWEETVKPGLKNALDSSLMPHLLIRTADGNFRFTPANGTSYTISSTSYDVPSWGERLVGDELSNSDPSFVGKQIKDVFFHRNRLGFLAGENIIMSQSSEFFNFYSETVTSVLDTDPIDIGTSNAQVSNLHHAIPYDTELLVFSDQTQFKIGGTSTITPKNVNALVTTSYTSSTVKPVGGGRNVYFVYDKGTYSGIREYYVDADADVNDAEDVTGNVPKYLPANVFKLAITTNENILCCLTSDEVNAVYVYQYYHANNKKLQSAWHKWTFGTTSNTKVLNVDFIDNYLYIVVQRSDGLYIEKIIVSPSAVDTGATYMTHLDRKLNEASTGVSLAYNSGTNQTTITIPYTVDNTMEVVTRNVSGSTTIAGQVIPTVSQTGTSIVVSGNYASSKLFIGEKYTFTYQFSKQYLRRENNGVAVAVTEGRLQIRTFNLNFTKTGFFQAIVTPENRDASTYTFTGATVGNATVNGVNLESSNYKFTVASQNEKLSIVLQNDKHLPCIFSSAEWEGLFYKRAS